MRPSDLHHPSHFFVSFRNMGAHFYNTSQAAVLQHSLAAVAAVAHASEVAEVIAPAARLGDDVVNVRRRLSTFTDR